MKTALIFGINGFVGPYLANELKESGYRIIGSDVSDFNPLSGADEYSKCDILNATQISELIWKYKPTHIINLAAISSVGQSWNIPSLTIQVNICGTINILESCLAASIKPSILLIGSSEEYIPSNEPMSEKTEINANNPYGISKIAQEQLAAIYREKYDWPIHCVRAFNHIGVGQRDSFVISSWCKQVAEIELGKREPILYVGNLKAERDFTDVRDIVRAYRLVLENGNPSEIYNIGSGNCYSLKKILSLITSLSSKDISVEIDKSLLRLNDNLRICCDNHKIMADLNWKPNIDISTSIKSIYESYLEGFKKEN